MWLFFSLLCPVASLNVLIYLTLVGRSHVQFVSTLIDILTERGHTVVRLHWVSSFSAVVSKDFIHAKMNSDVRDTGSNRTRNYVEVGFEGTSPWNASESLTIRVQL